MNKLLPILLLFSIGFIDLIKAQEIDSIKLKLDSLEAGFDPVFRHDIDSLRLKLERFKKYKISRKQIGDNWIKQNLTYNENCDSVKLNDTYYSLTQFAYEFDKFLANGNKDDTIVFLIDGRNLSFWNTFKLQGLVVEHLDKVKDKGVYCFGLIPLELPRKKIKEYLKTDTIDLNINKIIKYNGINIKYSDLKKRLQMNTPERIIIRTDNALPVQDLVDIMQIGNDLKIRMILGTKK